MHWRSVMEPFALESASYSSFPNPSRTRPEQLENSPGTNIEPQVTVLRKAMNSGLFYPIPLAHQSPSRQVPCSASGQTRRQAQTTKKRDAHHEHPFRVFRVSVYLEDMARFRQSTAPPHVIPSPTHIMMIAPVVMAYLPRGFFRVETKSGALRRVWTNTPRTTVAANTTQP